MNLGIIASSKKKYLQETLDYYAAVKAAGGQLNGKQLDSANWLIGQLKANNLWNDLDIYYPIIGADGGTGYGGDPTYSRMMAHSVNLKRGTPATANNYDLIYNSYTTLRASDHTEYYWASGNATNNNGYPNGYYFVSGQQYDLSIGGTIFLVSYDITRDFTCGNSSSSPCVVLGAYITSGQGPRTNMYANTGNGFVQSSAAYVPALNTNTYVYSARTSSTSLKLYKEGSLIATQSGSYTGPIPLTTNKLTFGSASNYTPAPRRYKSFWVAKGWDDTKMSTMYSLENQFNTYLGR